MPPDFEQRILHRVDDSLSHLIFLELVSLMDAGDDNVKLFEDAVGIIQRAVPQNIGFSSTQYLNRHFFLYASDLIPLLLQSVELKTSRIVSSRRMISDRYVLHAHSLCGRSHFLHGVAAIGISSMAMNQSFDVRDCDQIRRNRVA